MITNSIIVNDKKIGFLKVGNIYYISLTDLARIKNVKFPGEVIIKWMSNKSSFDFYSLWEELNNINFKVAESRQFKNESGSQSFTMSPSYWISLTNSIGFISKRGKFGGTFAHPDIAFEFASWLSPEFKLYLITEFERLKKKEKKELNEEWIMNRELTKVNYLLQTESIKDNIIPKVTDKQKKFVYAEEADVLNVALFGITAKEWRIMNPELAKSGNIRDYTDILHLIILNNLECYNSELIKQGILQSERLSILNNTAINQMDLLCNKVYKLNNH